mmetsp:Transcript_101653/g.185504  ORF Transcript_101653/g.185504 Transcript_101653/m.185504 type:complete len:303 (+) Transcript_101653:2754-3662(+)
MRFDCTNREAAAQTIGLSRSSAASQNAAALVCSCPMHPTKSSHTPTIGTRWARSSVSSRHTTRLPRSNVRKPQPRGVLRPAFRSSVSRGVCKVRNGVASSDIANTHRGKAAHTRMCTRRSCASTAAMTAHARKAPAQSGPGLSSLMSLASMAALSSPMLASASLAVRPWHGSARRLKQRTESSLKLSSSGSCPLEKRSMTTDNCPRPPVPHRATKPTPGAPVLPPERRKQWASSQTACGETATVGSHMSRQMCRAGPRGVRSQSTFRVGGKPRHRSPSMPIAVAAFVGRMLTTSNAATSLRR